MQLFFLKKHFYISSHSMLKLHQIRGLNLGAIANASGQCQKHFYHFKLEVANGRTLNRIRLGSVLSNELNVKQGHKCSAAQTKAFS